MSCSDTESVITNLSIFEKSEHFDQILQSCYQDVESQFGSEMDLTLVCKNNEGLYIPVNLHLAMLCSQSPYLMSLISSVNNYSSGHSNNVIFLPEVKADTAWAMVDMLYSGRSKSANDSEKMELVKLLMMLGMDNVAKNIAVQIVETVKDKTKEDMNEVANKKEVVNQANTDRPSVLSPDIIEENLSEHEAKEDHDNSNDNNPAEISPSSSGIEIGDTSSVELGLKSPLSSRDRAKLKLVLGVSPVHWSQSGHGRPITFDLHKYPVTTDGRKKTKELLDTGVSNHTLTLANWSHAGHGLVTPVKSENKEIELSRPTVSPLTLKMPRNKVKDKVQKTCPLCDTVISSSPGGWRFPLYAHLARKHFSQQLLRDYGVLANNIWKCRLCGKEDVAFSGKQKRPPFLSHLGAKHKLIEKYIDMKDYIKNHQEELNETVVKPQENMNAYVVNQEEDTKAVVETNDLYVKDLSGIMIGERKAMPKMPVKKIFRLEDVKQCVVNIRDDIKTEKRTTRSDNSMKRFSLDTQTVAKKVRKSEAAELPHNHLISCNYCVKSVVNDSLLQSHIFSKHFRPDCETAIRQILDLTDGRCPLCPNKFWLWEDRQLNWNIFIHFSRTHRIADGLEYSGNKANQGNVEMIMKKFFPSC